MKEKKMEKIREQVEAYTRVYARIDLDAVTFNMESMKRNLAATTGMVGVVKADGYGHGAVPVALTIEPYVNAYAVATAEEGLMLRRHNITKPILILGPVHPRWYKAIIEESIRPVIFTMDQAKALSQEAVDMGKQAAFHLAVDTGMSRIGLEANEQGADLAVQICKCLGLRAEGIFTHFARADETDKTSAHKQLARFLDFVEMLERRGVDIPVKHCANSAAIVDLPETGFNWVRAGISTYGLYPSDEVQKERVALKPAMELKSFVTYVKNVEPGREISYGGTFTSKGTMKVATIPAGYGDGYPRNLSGQGYVLVRGKKAPILGRICMDQMMVDVSGIPDVTEGQMVTLLGKEGKEKIQVEDLARWGGGFHYEIVCNIGKRVPRIYIKGGEIIGSKDYMRDVYEDFL